MSREVTITRAAPLSLIQDLGRPGWARLGVPPSGALDAPALIAANRRVGNPDDAAGLEVLLGGLRLRAECRARVAVTGADVPLSLDGDDADWCVSMNPGQELRLGGARSGLRAYLAISGGITPTPVLGSRSTDVLTGLGPAPIARGDRLPLGAEGVPRPVDRPPPLPDEPLIPVLPGPRDEWFPELSAQLADRIWTVDKDSNRIGLRLSGRPLRRRAGELPSEPLVTGAVQVPADGQPLIFLNDHPTTGGYPVLGVVPADGLRSLAQARPGSRMRLAITAGQRR